MATEAAKVIDILNHNISLEHGAIVQYLLHAYAMGEGGVGAEVINIARTEMRHLKYFADVVVDLGGVPVLGPRGEMFLDAGSAKDMMANGVVAEEGAIVAYQAALDGLDHLQAQKIIERVLLDERFHKTQFQGFEDDAADLPLPFPLPQVTDPDAGRVVTLLNDAIGREYRAILFDVREYIRSRDMKLRDHLEEVMIWSMKRVGLVADEVSERRGNVNLLDVPDVPGPLETAATLAEAIADEEHRAAQYARLASQLDDPDFQNLLPNLQGTTTYSVERLREEAEKLAAQFVVGAAKCPFHATVGSLIGLPQS